MLLIFIKFGFISSSVVIKIMELADDLSKLLDWNFAGYIKILCSNAHDSSNNIAVMLMIVIIIIFLLIIIIGI